MNQKGEVIKDRILDIKADEKAIADVSPIKD